MVKKVSKCYRVLPQQAGLQCPHTRYAVQRGGPVAPLVCEVQPPLLVQPSPGQKFHIAQGALQ
jgi:hypothetical protein